MCWELEVLEMEIEIAMEDPYDAKIISSQIRASTFLLNTIKSIKIAMGTLNWPLSKAQRQQIHRSLL